MSRANWDIDSVRKFIEDCGYTLVSKEYRRMSAPIVIHCDKHGDVTQGFDSFHASKMCKKCKRETTTTNSRKTEKEVRELIESMGYEWVSGEYKNASSKLILRCPKHGLFESYYVKLYSGVRCRKCYLDSKYLTFDIVKENIEKLGYKCLEDHYVNELTPMRALCPIHGEFSLPYARFGQGRGCQKCGHEHQGLSIRGSKNAKWSGGRSATVEALRNVLWPWINEQLKKVNYTCEITGEKSRKLNVHHMIKFTHIVEVTMNELGIDFKPEVKDYSDEEWRRITRKLDENNRKMADPIVMLDTIHRRFHQFCGGCSAPTSYEQLEQFKEMLREEQEKKAG